MNRIFIAASEQIMPELRSSLNDYELLEATKSQDAERLISEAGIKLFIISVHFDDSRAVELVKFIRVAINHKDTPIIMVRYAPSELERFLRQTMDTMKTLRVINDYLELENDSFGQVKLREAAAKYLRAMHYSLNDPTFNFE